MKKFLIASLAASVVTLGVAAQSAPAEARCRTGCAIGIGAAAIVGGAIIGNAIANSAPPGYAYGGYAPAPGYVAYNDYYGPQPVGCPGGYWGRRPLYDRWGNQIGWSHTKFFCPY